MLCHLPAEFSAIWKQAKGHFPAIPRWILVKYLTLGEKQNKKQEGNAFQTDQQTPQKGPSQAFPWIPQSFWLDFQNIMVGKGDRKSVV